MASSLVAPVLSTPVVSPKLSVTLVMLAMAPMLALGHGCCPHAGMAADGGGEPGEVDELPAACELEPELLLLLLLLTLLGLTLSCAAS